MNDTRICREVFSKQGSNSVITMMNTHLYEFNGKIFLQQAGGPIDLRGTCAVERVVMNHWDTLWIGLLKAEKMTHEEVDIDWESWAKSLPMVHKYLGDILN